MPRACARGQISAALSGGVDLSKISLRKSAIGEGARKNLYSERNGNPATCNRLAIALAGLAGLGWAVFHTGGAAFAVLTGSGIESRHLHTASGQQFSLKFGEVY